MFTPSVHSSELWALASQGDMSRVCVSECVSMCVMEREREIDSVCVEEEESTHRHQINRLLGLFSQHFIFFVTYERAW